MLKRENQRYVDPGFFIFRGRTRREDPPEPRREDPRQEEVLYRREDPSPKENWQADASPKGDIDLQEVTCPEEIQQEDPCPIEEKMEVNLPDTFDEHPRSNGVSKEVQTLCCGLPPMQIPPVPEDERELEMYLVFLCNGIDAACRCRELAKQRLEGIRKSKRKSVNMWEKENRKLREELRKLKEQDSLEL
ncbi:hypothetical protein FSP39_007947 [Pinctada imbricata]|uniref:Uncharacterized protein n=1 Tax=Pinctada imbricata TaxID=66713 RepID=A0AA88XIC4_PINIB|nr:hypothetical protein FSP39_007947 [Pinctada imbricata]